MEETINLQELLLLLKTRIWLLILCVFIGVGAAAGVTFLWMTPQYSARVQLLVASSTGEEGNNLQLNDLNANILMINTYKDVILSDAVLSQVHDVLAREQIDLSEQELKKQTEVIQSQNSQMFEIKVTNPQPEMAVKIANTVAEVFQEQLGELIPVDKVSILSYAQQNNTPVSPNTKLNLVIGAVLGLLVGAGWAVLLEVIDYTVKTSAFVTEKVDFPVLGTISQMSSKELAKSKKINLSAFRSSNEQQSELESESKKGAVEDGEIKIMEKKAI